MKLAHSLTMHLVACHAAPPCHAAVEGKVSSPRRKLETGCTGLYSHVSHSGTFKEPFYVEIFYIFKKAGHTEIIHKEF